MKKRVCKLIIALTLSLLLGLGYAFFVVKTGIAIPCMFHLFTGFYCPGCGTSRMCIAIIQGDFYHAFYYNPFIFCIIPLFGFYIVRQTINYIKGVKWQMSTWELILWKSFVVLLILYGIIRNLPGMDVLRP
ncbi:MAG: DUF2752 domain-containing protein [Velocimicrobium sp.]